MRHLLLIIGCLLCSLTQAYADVVQTVRFETSPVLFVWDETGLLQTGRTVILNPDLPFQDVTFPGSGQLAPIQANFSKGFAETYEVRFRVASNSGFAIKTRVMSDSGLRSGLVSLSQTETGPNAGATPIVQSGPNTFKVAHRTAAEAGTPRDQSVEFVATWQGAGSVPLVIELTTLEPH